jgi:NAD(P)-dependent dehydrogenase (short-subunit alcohol dehydrogenase family)
MPSDEILPFPQPAEPDDLLAPEPDAEAATPALDLAGRLVGRVALVSGGDGPLGSAVALALAQAGADVAILYAGNHEAAQTVMHRVVDAGRETMALAGDVGDSAFCNDAVNEVVKRFGRIDILVNAAAEPPVPLAFETLEDARLERSFRTNILGQIFLARAAMPHLPNGGSIVNTSAAVAFHGHADLVGEAASQAAVVGFTRSLALAAANAGVRVNAVAPVAACPPPSVARSYVFLASDDALCMTGQILHPNGGAIVLAV